MTSHLHDNSTRFEIRSRNFMFVDNIVNDVIDDVNILRIPGVSQILNSRKFINIWAEASNRGRNVEILIGYFGIIPNCRYSLSYNTHLNGPQDGSHLQNFEIFHIVSVWHQIWEKIIRYLREHFDADDVRDGVTWIPWTLPSISTFRTGLSLEQILRAISCNVRRLS